MLIHYLRERCADLFQGYVPIELQEGEKPPMEPEPLLPAISTLGTDLITLSRPGTKKTDPPEVVEMREVGGGLCPLWKSFIRGGSVKAMLFVVDSGAPEKIGSATVHLVEMLSSPQLESASVMIVFSKTDVECSRFGEFVRKYLYFNTTYLVIYFQTVSGVKEDNASRTDDGNEQK
jgi:hypothetical protein